MKKIPAWAAAVMVIAMTGAAEGGSTSKSEKAEAVKHMAEHDLIVYKPEAEVWQTVTIWTNVDCPHCRRVHGKLEEMGRIGIRVRYAAWPWNNNEAKMRSVWCAPDRHMAMEKAKKGRSITFRECDDTMAQQQEVGRSIGIRAVPQLVTESGESRRGYKKINQWLGKARWEKRRMDRRAEKARQRELGSENGQSRVGTTDMSDGR